MVCCDNRYCRPPPPDSLSSCQRIGKSGHGSSADEVRIAAAERPLSSMTLHHAARRTTIATMLQRPGRGRHARPTHRSANPTQALAVATKGLRAARPRALLISTTDGRRAAMGVLTVGSNLALLTACEPPAEALMAGATGAPRVIKGTDG